MAFFRLLTILVSPLFAFAASADVPRLTVYTYDAFAADWGPGPAIEKAFEARCACDLVLVTAESSIGALRKVQLEGMQTKADIVLGLDNNIAEAARESGLFIPHQVDLSALTLPIPWRDPLFAPFDYGYLSFIYDSKKIKQPPVSFKELGEMDDQFKILIQDPRASTPGLGLLLWVRAAYGDQAHTVWSAVASKILTVTKSWSDSYALFLKGEADMVLSYTTSPAYHMVTENESRYKAAPFNEGHYLQLELAGVVGTTKQPERARQFIRFMYSDAFQDAIPTGNWMYPVRNTQTGLPDAFAQLHKPQKALHFDAHTIATKRKAWIDEWRNALSQ